MHFCFFWPREANYRVSNKSTMYMGERDHAAGVAPPIAGRQLEISAARLVVPSY